MNTRFYQDKMAIGCCTMGSFQVTITFRGKEYSCTSNNTMAYDTIRTEDPVYYGSVKRALKALWDECKIKNELIKLP